jgi:putative nucleotidyltransferase with HDIG domain
VLVVDDDPEVNKALKRLLSRGGFRVLTAPGPMEAISILRKQEVAVAVVDQMMPGMTGIELLSLIRQSWPATVGMLITASNDIQVAAEAINRHLVHYFVPKPWKSAELRGFVREAAQVHRSQLSQAEWLLKLNTSFRRQIKEKASKAALSIAREVDARDGCTRNHSKRVAAFALAVGRAMGLGDGALSDLRVGALLHDVGKLAIPDEILLKPGKLTDKEFEEIKTHPAVGASIVGPLGLPGNVTAVIRQHHENHDGSGYPARIGGGDIALPARIIHAADALEAMSSERVYRKAPLPEWAPKELQRYRGIQFDPDVIDVLLGELQAGRLAASE